ncbi:hypothetical protein ColTof3_04616 [Colletotrichum tofieldiae]|nr:hypothetical protein ColTof3_04616 [Colletotrichum tofieldiae]
MRLVNVFWNPFRVPDPKPEILRTWNSDVFDFPFWILSGASLMTQEPVAWGPAIPILRTAASQCTDLAEISPWLPARHSIGLKRTG